VAVKLTEFAEREHDLADIAGLLAVVGLALVTWSYLADAVAMPPWRTYTSVGLTILFALAALTRRSHWAASIRFLMGGWLIVAPYLLGFADIAPAAWAYLTAGAVLVTLSMPASIWRLAAARRPASRSMCKVSAGN
jgi:hypothetical protein